MVLGLFETGYLYGAAKGFFEYDRGHLSRDVDRMAVRLADAMYRGAMLAWHLNDTGRAERAPTSSPPTGSQHADRPLDEVRAEFGLLPRPSAAIAGGFEDARGSRVASRRSSTRTAATSRRPKAHEYDSYGAEPA